MTIADAAARLRAGTLTPTDLVERCLEQYAAEQPRTNAFIRLDEGEARELARRATRELAAGHDRGLLHGIPISIKDLIDVAGAPTTAASRVLANSIPAEDAPLVTRLREAGAVVFGKTNLHEFALGTTSEDSAYGAVHNPLDVSRSAGGSSGGSAAAVATGMGLASIGTDTGGSIRIPAAACGVVGLKPSFGEVPTTGVIPLSTSFDHAGPLALTVEDAGLVWAALAGQLVRPIAAQVPTRLKRLTGYFDRPLEPAVRTAFERALDMLRRAGIGISDAELSSTPGIMDAYVNVVLPEGAAWHHHFLNSRGGDYTPLVRARFEAGRAIAATKYVDAQAFCRTLQTDVDTALEDADALVLPTLPILAPVHGTEDMTVDPAIGGRTPVRSVMLKHTQPFNMSGHPAISIPIAGAALPVGLQLVGRRGRTARLLAIAAACEKIMGDA